MTKKEVDLEIVAQNRATIPIRIRKIIGIKEGDVVTVEIEKIMRLNPSTGWYEEVGGDSESAEVEVDEDEGFAGVSHTLSRHRTEGLDEESKKLDSIFKEENWDGKKRRRETGR